MNKKDFEKMLKLENSSIEIEMSKELKSTKISQKDKYVYQVQTKNTSLIPRFVSIFACLVFSVFCLSLFFVKKDTQETAVGMTSYIMEINPSICITTDENDTIINVCALNYDADAIVLDNDILNIEGQSFENGIDKLMRVIRDKGFFESHEDAIRIYAFNDNSECEYKRLNYFEELMKKKMAEFGYDIQFEKHRIGMDDFREKIGYDEECQTLNDMQDFFMHRGRGYIPPEASLWYR